MDQGSLAVIMLLVIAALTAVGIVALSALIGRREAPAERNIHYECGLDPASRPLGRFPIKFFLIGVLFLIFDVEIVFLIPWAAAFREAAGTGAAVALTIELLAFTGLLALALVFAWARGALEWER